MGLDQWIFLGNSLDRWAVAGCIFLGVLLLALALRSIVVARLGKMAAHTETRLDDLAILLLRNTHIIFFALIALHLSAGSLTFAPKANKVINFTFFLVLFTQFGLWANQALYFLGNDYVQKTLERDAGRATTMRAMVFFGQVFIWIVVFLLLLDNWGVKVGPFVAGLGIGGIAFALAVQNTLADLFASLSILFDRPFVIGDSIAVDNEGGTVEYIGLKTTRLKRNSGEQLIFSNSDLLKSRIRNFKRMQERRVLLRIGVLYETDPAKLEAIPGWMKEIVLQQKDLRFGRAHLYNFGPSSLDYEMEYWVNGPDNDLYMNLQQTVGFALIRKFQAEGVEFAYPTQKVFVEGPASARP